MVRIPMVAGNWKMHKTAGEGAILTQHLEDLARKVKPGVEVVVAPPFTALQSVSSAIAFDRSPIRLAAQNVYWEDSGAFTGEIAPPMLADLRVNYVIVGHSERRQLFGDTDETVSRKARAICAHGMTPIVCCGEELALREAAETLPFIEGQIR
ncbi:MAG: triose-phosphate isomerase, partial [Actinomycetes bacterium]|nr:triose-phosphate isomerase [Actinomycetes bacterium]